MSSQLPAPTEEGQPLTTGLLLGAFGCAAFVILALVAEVVAAEYSESPVPSWAIKVFPLGWSQQLRVVWWLSVAAAALGFRVLRGRLGMRQHGWVTVVTVAPFVAFAAGVAWGASWATWH